MIESEVIVRLEAIVERLIRVQEENLNSELEKQKSQASCKANSVDNLTKLEPLFKSLARAKEAKELLDSARNTSGVLLNYLNAAQIVHESICELSASDTDRVFCGIEISPTLNFALLKAMNQSELSESASEVYDFVNKHAPARSWTYDDFTEPGTKSFKLVATESDFVDLITTGSYREITEGLIGGIRLAYKQECVRIILSGERKEKEDALRKAIGRKVFDTHYKTCIEILYPDSLYKGTYQIYIPAK